MTTTDTQRLQKTLQAAKERGVLPADVTLPEDERPSWIILGLSFVGAQLAVWPFLAFLAFTMHEILRKPSGSLVMSMAFLATGVFVLRGREKSLYNQGHNNIERIIFETAANIYRLCFLHETCSLFNNL